MGILFGIILGLAFGAVHYAAHRLKGNPAFFDEAGVKWAGISIVVLGFIVGLLIGP